MSIIHKSNIIAGVEGRGNGNAERMNQIRPSCVLKHSGLERIPGQSNKYRIKQGYELPVTTEIFVPHRCIIVLTD